MKKYKKTYAILHLAEKHTVFNLGKTKVHVSFTGGQVTKNGVNPATFTTEDPLIQFAIENSTDFKSGAITIRTKYLVEGEVKIGKNQPKSQNVETIISQALNETDRKIPDNEEPEQKEGCASGSIQEQAPETTDKDCSGGIQTDKESFTEDSFIQEQAHERTDNACSDTREESFSEDDGNGVENALEVVEVSCKDVAKQYLQEHFGEKPSPLRTIADVQECAAKYGITFKFV